MVKDKMTAEVSGDKKRIICRSADGQLRWVRSGPSYYDWNRLAKHPVFIDIEAGIFQYVGDEIRGGIIAVFTPGRSLDFNLPFTAETGDLISIDEAR